MSDITENNQRTIVFDASKGEAMVIKENFKSLQRRLKGSWKLHINREEITEEVLNDVALFIIPGPMERFTENEFNTLKKYIEVGGSVLVLLGEGGERVYQTNINFLLEEYGIMVNSDTVVRTNYHKYFYPKECLVIDGILNRAVSQACAQLPSSVPSERRNKKPNKVMNFLYPYGATLNVAKPAVAVLSSGSVAFPLNRPVCAVYSHKGEQPKVDEGGKLGVIGSVHFLADPFIDKEDNDRLMEVLFKYLTSSEISLNAIDAEAPEISDNVMVPDTRTLAERPRSCLQEPTDDIPTDYTRLFNNKLYGIHTNVLSHALQAYTDLKVKHEPLRLISPQFEAPLPLLQAAVFPPSFQDLPPPPLELFDLEDAFSSDRSRLAQLANKCLVGGNIQETDETDLEYFIRECGHVLNVNIIGTSDPDAKQVLHHVCMLIAENKKEAVLNKSA